MKKALILLVAIAMFLMCVFFIAPKSGFTQEFVYGDIFVTPKTSINFFGGYTGGDRVGSMDWGIGNCSPFGIRTNDMVFSTCEGVYRDPNAWQERMRITKNGNVGIGTASPAGKLEVADPSNYLSVGILTDVAYPLRVSRNGTAGILLTDVFAAGDEKNFYMGYTRGVAPNPASFYFAAIDDTLTVSTPLMSLTRAGKVGIGTTSPYAKLEVENDVAGMRALAVLGGVGGNGNEHAIFGISSGVSGSPQLVLYAPQNLPNTVYAIQGVRAGIFPDGPLALNPTGGNVGIGTTSPETKLDVEGTVQAYAFETGDIVFRKDGEKLWRMFEDEKGLYLESLKTGETSRIFLEKDIEALRAENKALEARLAKIEALLKVGQ